MKSKIIEYLSSVEIYNGSIKSLSETLGLPHSSTWRHLKELQSEQKIIIENISSKTGVTIYYINENNGAFGLIKLIREDLFKLNAYINSLESYVLEKEKENIQLKAKIEIQKGSATNE